MSSRNLDNWIDGYMEYTSNSEPPELYRKWIAVSCVAAALRRKVHLSWGPQRFYPNLYIVLVGSSGRCRKGTAMGIGAMFLKDLGVEMASEAITREALIRELSEATDSVLDTDAGRLELSTALTIYSQELTVFLGYDNKQLISDLTDWFDCRDKWTYRTKGMGTDELTGVWVNLIGATTPQLIQSALPPDAIGGGLSSRMIFVYEEDKGKVVPFPFLAQTAAQDYQNLLQDLQKISLMRGEFYITQQFMERWGKWYIEQDNNPPFKNNLNFEGYVNRRPTHILKLSMIMSAAQTDELVVTSDHFDMALDLLEATEKKMEYTFAGYGTGGTSEVLSRIIRYLRREGQCSSQQLYKSFYTDLDSIEQMEQMLQLAIKAGQIRRVADSKMNFTYHYIQQDDEDPREDSSED